MDVEEAFRRHHDELYRYLARQCGDPATAHDVAQEAFLRLQQQGSLHDHAAVRSWLFTTGLNVLRDLHRTHATRQRLLERHPGRVPQPSPDPDPVIELERKEDRVRLRRALASLREPERTAVLMREEGFKHREIAEALGTSTGSVGTLINRALQKLERALTAHGGPA